MRGLYVRRAARAAILIDRRLTRREMRAVLAHELVHDERGGGCDAVGMPPSWRDVVARDEHAVEREVARWLVPHDLLQRFVESRVGADVGVTVWETAEEFGVPEYVAERALRALGDSSPDGWNAV